MAEKNNTTKLEKMGLYIKEARENKINMTQEQLADALGVSRQTVSKWERGVNAPDIMMLKNICKVLKVNIYELLDGEKKPKNYDPSKMNEIKIFNKKIYIGKVFKFILLFLIFIIFEIGLYYGISTYLYNERKWNIYALSCEEGEIFASGKIISNKEESIYNIDYLHFISPNVETDLEPRITYIKISLYYDDVNLYTLTETLDEPMQLSHYLSSKIMIYNTKNKKYVYNENANIKIFIEYLDKDGETYYQTANLK